MDNTFLTKQTKHKSNFEKKYIERFGGVNEYPEGLPALTPQMYEKKKEMQQTNNDLDEARTKFETWKTNFQRKQKEVDEKQRALDMQKENLKTFYEHHNIEIEKARKKEQEEKAKIKEMQEQYKKLCEDGEEIGKLNDGLKKQVEELQPFADYLQAVVDKTHYFENIESILNRYETLTTAQTEYVDKFQGVLQNFGTDGEALSRQLSEKRETLLGKTMQLARSKQNINNILAQNHIQRTNMIKEMQRLEMKNTELAEIKSAIKTIFERALEQSITNAQRASVGPEPTLEQMILFIRNRFHDLDGILSNPNKEYAPVAPPPPKI